ncbi:MAG TPA: disulfide bond formation protein B [Negativicutes bacterium]|nr:disulfide bond formation protein B [Negativicutes bacterium]
MNPQILSAANYALAALTIAAQVFLVLIGASYLFWRNKFSEQFLWLSKNGMALAFLVALFSMLASLFYSNIAGFEPCVLCWYQRIFMYPLVFLLGVALAKKSRQIIDYILPLPVIGFLIALYHCYIYYFASAGCQLAGRGVSCTQRYVFEFGYITIPLMALTAFALVIVLLVFANLDKHE